jgi:hypothetical protein
LPLPQPVLHTVRSNASSFNFQYPLFSLISFCSCLRHLLRLTITSTPPSIFSSTTCFRRQLIRKMWPNPVILHVIVCRIFLSSFTLCNTSPTPHFTISDL